MLEFEWDIIKAESNLKKHGISFNEAKSVFEDFSAFIFDDEKHSKTEKRELIIGYSNLRRLLIVCYMMRNDKIRIINVRQTNKIERKRHEENRKQ
ncbi:MAG: BrnT family toxin [Candidatus Kapabacteria bacterium]|nr:BrnT family toxin [Candidatus Kapabacteria bacterium]